MTSQRFAIAVIAALLLSSAGNAQNASDLLQKGLHLQEAAGDVDGAIVFFRQVVSSAASTNKPLAAQAQYQLVLCMLQKGDRATAEKELAALANNFPSMPDLVEKARKLIPGSAALLPSPWGDTECSQLNIKRDGAETGEYLYYSADAWTVTVTEKARKDYATAVERNPIPPDRSDLRQAVFLRWELKTKNSSRSIEIHADRDTLRPTKPWNHGQPDNSPKYHSDDDLGDPLAVPFTGPATDVEGSAFLLRRLPLAVGYKTTIPVTSNTIAPVPMELVVTGIESVQTLAGKFNCYKVSFASIGQTFWIGVEGARPLVKFQSGSVEADLVKTWGAEDPMEPITKAMKTGGMGLSEPFLETGGMVRAELYFPSANGNVTVWVRKIHTPAPEIAQSLQRALAEITGKHNLNPLWDYKVRPGSLQTRTIGGQSGLTCLLDYFSTEHNTDSLPNRKMTVYATWIGTEDETIQFWAEVNPASVGTFRWQFEPFLAALRIP
jgi:hypothetical protein